jgi:hypothetical protein
MGKPQVTIEVEEGSGIWRVDGMPMILVPRHFFVNYHRAVEAQLGLEAARALWWDSGHRSAFQWCEKEAKTHGLAGIAVFHHYMKRLSQRGWAQFSVLDHDPASGRTRVRVDNSVFVLQDGGKGGRACYAFRGWFVGALDYVGTNLGRPFPLLGAEETQCAAEGHAHCVFEVAPSEG